MARNRKPSLLAFALAWFVMSTPACVLAQQASGSADNVGTVVVAKSTGAAVVIWDATPFVTQIVSEKKGNDEGLRLMKVQALAILGDKAGVLKDARSITVNATYAKSGAVSPVYGSATFAGIERVFSLSAPRAAFTANAKNIDAGGKLPAGYKLIVSGKLPPS